jgi:hypothetical protein
VSRHGGIEETTPVGQRPERATPEPRLYGRNVLTDPAEAFAEPSCIVRRRAILPARQAASRQESRIDIRQPVRPKPLGERCGVGRNSGDPRVHLRQPLATRSTKPSRISRRASTSFSVSPSAGKSAGRHACRSAISAIAGAILAGPASTPPL